MTEIKNSLSLKPIAGYTRLYLHNFKTPWGAEISEIVHGKIKSHIGELLNHCEYDCTDHKYLGIGMVTIVPVRDAANNPINTDDCLYEEAIQ